MAIDGSERPMGVDLAACLSALAERLPPGMAAGVERQLAILADHAAIVRTALEQIARDEAG